MSKYLTADGAAGDAPSRGKRRTNRRAVLSLVLGALLIAFGVIFGVLAFRMVRNHTNFNDTVSGLFVAPPQTVFAKDRIYLLVLGVDFNYDEKGMPYSKGARSDSIKVVGIDFPTKTVKVVSVLRDTEAIVNGHDSKINEAYSSGGVKLADQIVGDFIGLPKGLDGKYFDRFIVVNSFGVKDFVDAIGGIDIKPAVSENMDYDDNWGHLHIHIKKGTTHLNGIDALGYSRFRHDACSDPCRVQRQDQVIKATIDKIAHDRFNTLEHIGSLQAVANKNIYTNLNNNEELSLAWAFKDQGSKALANPLVINYKDTKTTAYGGEVLIPDPDLKAKALAMLTGPYEAPATAAPAALDAVKPSSVHVIVQNGSGVAGMAGQAATLLRKAGYHVDDVGNAKSFEYDATQLLVAAKVPFVGERVRRDLAVPSGVVSVSTDATPGPSPLVTVIVGKDFATAQAAPAASAAP